MDVQKTILDNKFEKKTNTILPRSKESMNHTSWWSISGLFSLIPSWVRESLHIRSSKVFIIVSSCWRNSVSKMMIKSAVVRTRRKAVRTLKEFYFLESLVYNLVCKPVQISSINNNSREPHLQCRLNSVRTLIFFCMMTFTKNVISRVLDLSLEQALRCWKVNSNIYKVMFHEVQVIPIFTRWKRAIKRRL